MSTTKNKKTEIDNLSILELSTLRQECEYLIIHYKNVIEVNRGFTSKELSDKHCAKYQKLCQIKEIIINKIEEKLNEIIV
jgi:hypothetical protein